jgi:LCP family protein required for cell wall assembly
VVVTLLSALGFGAYDWVNGSRRTFREPPTESTGGSTGPVAEDILGKCAEQACNFLLLGSDSREGLTPEEQVQFGTDEDIGGENRSDTIILVHTRPGQREAIFLSFPRDLWVEIPGMGTGKINSAFEGGVDGGGPFRVARTVRELTGMPVHHVMYVSLAGFQGLVDALGGVNMCVPYPMFDELTALDIDAGCQEFDGATALAYVRTRHQPCDNIPDFARINRQQQFLRAVIAEILSPSQLVNLPSLVPELLDNLVVDEGLNVADLVYLAGTLQDVGTEDADFRSVPSTPAGTYVNGQFLSIVNAIEPDASELFRRIRENRPLGDLGLELPGVPPSPANIVTAVVDRSGAPVAADVLDILTDGGFNTSPGLVPRSTLVPPTNGSIILYAEGAEPMARVVGSYFPNMELVPSPPRTMPEGVDVAVVVTGSYELPPEPTEEPVECPA